MPKLFIFPSAQELDREAALATIDIAKSAIESRGSFHFVLSGGSTPRLLYTILASDEFRDRIDWSRAHIYWGDERCVPPDHADSNYRMAREALLDRVPIPDQNIYRMRGEEEPFRAASEYQSAIEKSFGSISKQMPSFDLILLGLGEDGHTASLFPETEALDETDKWVVANYVPKVQRHRITMTYPILNNAANVIFLVAGKSKSEVIADLLGGFRGEHRNAEIKSKYPAGRVQPTHGHLSWYVDRSAASELD